MSFLNLAIFAETFLSMLFKRINEHEVNVSWSTSNCYKFCFFM